MSENIDERQQAVRDTVKDFAEKEIKPISDELERMPEPRKFPTELYKKMGTEGFIGFGVPKELGGHGKSRLEFVTLVEELSYHDSGVGLMCAVGDMATYPVVQFASGDQKKKYVPDCATGKKIPAFVLTEPDVGSDAAQKGTVASDKGGHYLLSGEKIFVMHGDVAELGVIFCAVDGSADLSAFIVDDTSQAGWEARTLKDKLGMRVATTGGILLSDFRVPKENLLGKIGEGSSYAAATLDSARISTAAIGVGMAQRALNESIAYAKERHAFGQPIAKLQAIQWMIAEMGTRLDAARAMTYQAVLKQDAGEDFAQAASMAKHYVIEATKYCVDRAMQIHAGYGYIGEFSPIEKLYRDQPVLDILEDGSEVQRLVIAANVMGR